MHKLLRYESKRIIGRIKGNYWHNQRELLAQSKRTVGKIYLPISQFAQFVKTIATITFEEDGIINTHH